MQIVRKVIEAENLSTIYGVETLLTCCLKMINKGWVVNFVSLFNNPLKQN